MGLGLLLDKNTIISSKLKALLVMMSLALIIFLPRIWQNDKFVTVDEGTKFKRGANFYYALGQREFEETHREYSPLVITMEIGAASMHLMFPEYRGLGQGYFVEDTQFNEYLIRKGQNPLEILVVARLIMIVIITFVLLLAFYLGWQLLGFLPALLGVLLIAFDPYYLGHSRLLTQEGLISVSLLLSILAFLTYLYRDRKIIYLVISAGAGAFSCLTKSSSTIIIPFIGLMILIDFLSNHRNFTGKKVREKSLLLYKNHFSPLLIWLLVFSFTYIAFFPAMWVDSINTLKDVYGSAINFVFQDDNAFQYSQAGDINSNLWVVFKSYFTGFLLRSSPIVWAGLLMAFVSLITFKNLHLDDLNNKTIVYVSLFGIMFLLMMSFASSKKAAHYIMTTHVCLDFIAGLGLARFIDWIKNNGRFHVPRYVIPTLILSVVLLQAVSAIPYFPYYYTYKNPIMVANTQDKNIRFEGYGEGLDLAAIYLSQKPNAEELTVMSWYGPGPFAYLFPGKTEHIYPLPGWTAGSIRRLEQSDYLVIYYFSQKSRNLPSTLMAALDGVVPEHSIFLYEIEYVRIYKTSELPARVFVADNK